MLLSVFDPLLPVSKFSVSVVRLFCLFVVVFLFVFLCLGVLRVHSVVFECYFQKKEKKKKGKVLTRENCVTWKTTGWLVETSPDHLRVGYCKGSRICIAEGEWNVYVCVCVCVQECSRVKVKISWAGKLSRGLSIRRRACVFWTRRSRRFPTFNWIEVRTTAGVLINTIVALAFHEAPS